MSTVRKATCSRCVASGRLPVQPRDVQVAHVVAGGHGHEAAGQDAGGLPEAGKVATAGMQCSAGLTLCSVGASRSISGNCGVFAEADVLLHAVRRDQRVVALAGVGVQQLAHMLSGHRQHVAAGPAAICR